MKRNKDLMKAIMNAIESHPDAYLNSGEVEEGVVSAGTFSWPEIRLHLSLLEDCGLVDSNSQTGFRLTSAGYDALETGDPIANMKRWIALAGD